MIDCMQMKDRNSIEIGKEERPQVSEQDILAMVQQLDPDDYDDAVQQFLEAVECGREGPETLQHAATLLLQDEVDLAPEFKKMGIEPDEKLIEVLLALGADPNVPNAYGELPLNLAVRHGYHSVVRMLILAGADLTLRNHRGKSARDLATDDRMKDLLRS